MDNISFYNSFGFSRIELRHDHHTDNSAGIKCHFLARMLTGHAEIEAEDGEVIHLRPGDVFYLPYGLKYHSYWHVDERGAVTWDSFRFLVFPSRSENSFRTKKLISDEAIHEMFDRISGRDADACTVGDFYRLLGVLMPQMEECAADARRLIMSRAKDYIAGHPDFTVTELAKHCNMSESGLYALFRKYEGITPIKMKHRIKAQEAERLLRTTNLSVEEISTRLGFCNAGYFRKSIKEQLGVSPREIRKNRELI